MATISLNNSLTFASEGNESLLEAAARNDVAIPYSCRTGRCNTCKCKIISGETTVLHDEIGLSESEKAQGWILSCARSAKTDVEVMIHGLEELQLARPKTFPCRVAEISRMRSDVAKVILRLPPSSDFEFNHGQYIEVIGEGGLRRSYSPAGISSDRKMVELHIREVEGGAMSAYWFERVKQNDLLRFHGPLGTFFLRDVSGLDLVFLATGTGIAPVKAMLEGLADAPHDGHPNSITVYWGGRTVDDLYWDPRVNHPNVNYIPVLSRANEHWTGKRGYVQNALIDDRLDLSRAVVYACGSNQMINDARDVLMANGLIENRFYSDAFVCSSITK
jgi:CDP-4-dehydro-6-deoxyglucose reductase